MTKPFTALITCYGARFAGLVLALSMTGTGAGTAAQASEIAAPCATPASLTGDASARSLVAGQRQDLIIAIRPGEPKVGRPVIAWLVGHQPGHLLVARQISWKFGNAASLLKSSGRGNGGSATTLYFTPGQKQISVSMTDMSGARRKTTCSFTVTW